MNQTRTTICKYSRWNWISDSSHFLFFLTPLWPETSGLRLPVNYQQKWKCQNSPSEGKFIEKCLISEHFIIPSWEEKSSIFSLNMYPIFLDNQVYFILNTIIWSKFCRKMFLYLCKYSYKANMWIFTWNSKHTNSFWKEKGKKRKWSNQSL